MDSRGVRPSQGCVPARVDIANEVDTRECTRARDGGTVGREGSEGKTDDRRIGAPRDGKMKRDEEARVDIAMRAMPLPPRFLSARSFPPLGYKLTEE